MALLDNFDTLKFKKCTSSKPLHLYSKSEKNVFNYYLWMNYSNNWYYNSVTGNICKANNKREAISIRMVIKPIKKMRDLKLYSLDSTMRFEVKNITS